MLHGQNIHKLLTQTLRSVQTLTSDREEVLYSSILLSGLNGSIISYANREDTPASYNKSTNNLKMMSLLIRDKWNEDQMDPSAQSTSSCYTCELRTDPEDGNSEATHIYTYEIEDLHACVAQIPRSDLLLLFIGSGQYPYGLEVLKMKAALEGLASMQGYKLN
ncbi:LADA_0H06238g1_1 [Lachancea dasiensis]|uniref:LADA_0H06238g1_1 n=1 Tax=Lachancea dasiensis TaxID=1072105 RepID=A0A1G4K1S9_9SACH|nr:LADA_0H06238g1_1 [Lachancea dasiensis]